MREGQIRAMHEATARRSALLFGQWEFLDTRMRAFETVLQTSSVWQRLTYFIWPEDFMAAIDRVHKLLLDEGKRKFEEAAAKPRLTVVGR